MAILIPDGVLQIHPTRTCNLTCLHCYSDSGPGIRGGLPIRVVRDALDDACELGYRTVAFSGGEPLMYRELREALAHAKALGMRTAITTNGTLLSAHRLDPLASVLDVLAISLDGPEREHDRMRNRTGAFAAMVAGLPAVRALGVPFGFVFTLTQHNVDQVEWALDFALDCGAALLQIHPLEAEGRGAALQSSIPDAIENIWALVEANRLAGRAAGHLRLQIDVAWPAGLVSSVVAHAAAAADPTTAFAAIVSPLVIEADGRCVPVDHGFPERFGLGNVTGAPLRTLASEWRRRTLPDFLDLCSSVARDLTGPAAPLVFNWYGELTAGARGM